MVRTFKKKDQGRTDKVKRECVPIPEGSIRANDSSIDFLAEGRGDDSIYIWHI